LLWGFIKSGNVPTNPYLNISAFQTNPIIASIARNSGLVLKKMIKKAGTIANVIDWKVSIRAELRTAFFTCTSPGNTARNR